MTRKIVSIFCLLVFLLAGCSTATVPTTVSGAENGTPAQPGEAASWPTRGWQTSTPEAQGLDPAKLEQMLAEIKKRSLDLDGVLVIRNGYLVFETYYGSENAESLHVQYSVTKSFTATLLGIAVDQGKLDGVQGKVSEVLPGRVFQNPDSRKDAMTVEDLLTMSSGLDWAEGDASYQALYRSRDWVAWVMDLPMVADPGERFNYCSGCTHVLSAILQERVGTSAEAFGREHLFAPLGITNLRWETDSRGMSIGGWGLNLSARDMAKLGYLYLHNGAWDGKQVISQAWVAAATSKHASEGKRLEYGYQWWIDSKNAGAYAALGRGGQMIYVDPARDLIVVFTAGNESHDAELELIDRYVIPAVR